MSRPGSVASPSLAVILPVLNEAARLPATLASLTPSLTRMAVAEIVVVDAGSADDSVALARGLGARVIFAPRGRGAQLAAGIRATTAPWLLLLHADTSLAPGWDEAVARFIASPEAADRAGYFRFTLAETSAPARRLMRRVAWRSRVLGLPYGDQGLVISRALLARIGGVADWPLMEDVDLARRIGRGRLVALAADAVTSAARYQRGWRRRTLRNLTCLGLYFLGVPPSRLVAFYDRGG
uniref:Glycosyltransferase n=1 Tax=Acidicaldus sp. TaxID=1872105 RepID=A0A8J4M610_9PROT